MDDILSRLRAKKLLDKQSKPSYPQSNPPTLRDYQVALGDPNDFGALANIVGTPDMWSNIIKSQAEQDITRQMAQAQMNANVQQAQHFPAPVTPPNRPSTGATLSQRAREMFLKRMGGLRAEMTIAAEDYLHCHIFGDKVYLFYCFAGRDGCVKEDIDLFPSDQLITQFRMVLAT
jgi:hypothetical protein